MKVESIGTVPISSHERTDAWMMRFHCSLIVRLYGNLGRYILYLLRYSSVGSIEMRTVISTVSLQLPL